MPRQFLAQARFNGSDKNAILNPKMNVDRQMMAHPNVKKALTFMQADRTMLSVAVACGMALVTLSQFEQPAEAPHSWLFDREYPFTIDPTPEATSVLDSH